MALGQELPSRALSGVHPLTLPEASALQQTEPRSCIGSSDLAGMEGRPGQPREPACLTPSLCPDPTWLPLERQMLTNQAAALTHTQVCPEVLG